MKLWSMSALEESTVPKFMTNVNDMHKLTTYTESLKIYEIKPLHLLFTHKVTTE